jgi:DNA-binding beta-propeller fold protein YncE
VDRRQFLLAAAAAPFALRVPAVPAPVALVTCDAESRLAVVDLRSLRVTASLPTLPDPRAVETIGGVALVCHTAVGALSVVDRSGVQRVVRGLSEPRYAAAHPDGRHAFVTDSGHSGVVLVDVLRGRVVDRVSLPEWARHITISRDGSRVWAGLGSASDHVAVVDTARLKHVATLTPGFATHDVALAPDGRLWITSGRGRVLAVGAETHAADLAPQHVTFGNGRVFVTSGDSGTLHVQAHDGRMIARGRIPIGSYNVQYAHGRVVTPSLSHGTLEVRDAVGRHLRTLRVAGSCHDACILG